MPPLFTIGIPTYNRSALLRAALASATSQTWDSLEILVSDNASTDDTSEVVRQSVRPVRYLRNPSNLGAPRNFANLVESARGEYFAFLQDDDLLHSEFVAKAIDALTASPEATLYVAYAALTPSTETLCSPDLFGPPFPLDWCATSGRRVFDGRPALQL